MDLLINSIALDDTLSHICLEHGFIYTFQCSTYRQIMQDEKKNCCRLEQIVNVNYICTFIALVVCNEPLLFL